MFGERGCGAWTCVAGACQVVERCEDLDGDGFASGPDCSCIGEELDCDDGDSHVGDTSSVGCCNGGTRACVAGVWGLCSGATGETCDGVDDDCNGAIDDLGDITCGIGACRKTVPACAGATLGVCVPNPPLSDTDGCNGIDDDCDGAVDEDCAKCIHVSLDGDDAIAATNDGTTPFRSVQAAIDFADTHRQIANRVCVAAGSTCGSSATFTGPANAELTMREGISLLGNYESSCWSRCNDSTTKLELQTPRGVVFPPDISLQTTLDGFTLVPVFDAPGVASAPEVAAVSVDGARGVVLSNLSIGAAPAWPSSPLAYTGVALTNGALASVLKSRIDTLASGVVSAAVRAIDATVVVDENCPTGLSETTGRCAGACGASGAQIRDRIALENAPSSRIERSSICGSTVQATGGRSVLFVRGRAHGVVVRGNFVNARTIGGQAPSNATFRLEECNGDAPWIVDNESIQASVILSGYSEVIRAAGDCHPVIEANRSVRNVAAYNGAGGTAIVCAGGTKPSRCVISENPSVVGIYEDEFAYEVTGGRGEVIGTGVACRDASCARIVRNGITGIETNIHCRSCPRGGTGMTLSGGSPLVTENWIYSGGIPDLSPPGPFTGVSLTGVTNGRVANNAIPNSWKYSFVPPLGYFRTLSFDGSAREFEGNSVGPTLWKGGGTVRANCFYSFTEADAAADPLVFENNTLESKLVISPDPLPWGYVDENTTSLDAAAVNGLTDMTASGNTSGPCTFPPGP